MSRYPGLTATEPPTVFAVKSLLHPIVAVVSLFAFLLMWRDPPGGPNFLLITLVFIVVGNFFGVARIQVPSGKLFYLRSFLDILLRWIPAIAFIWALLHISRLADHLHHYMYVSWALFTPILLWGGQIAVQRALSASRSTYARPRKAVIVGVTDLGLRLEKHLRENSLLAIQAAGFFEDRSPARLPQHGPKILGVPSALPEFISRQKVDIVYVTLPMTRHPRILDLLEAMRDSTVSIYFVPDLFTFGLIQARFDVIGEMPVLAVRESPFFGARTISKRLTDVILASLIVILVAPLLLVVAAGVRLSSPGPILFKQRRYGLDGREIIVNKFRSMTVVENGSTQFTAVGRRDPRVTAFGSFIRKTSLDELPQLFNVLQGSMSIVGPRPHPIAMNEQYRRLIPGYMFRHKVKPGITGWAQVNGCRGGDDLESMRRRIDYDIEYLRRWSLPLDIAIILKTAVIMLRDKNAY